jgi:hypothetical protein
MVIYGITSNWQSTVDAIQNRRGGPPPALEIAFASLGFYLALLALPYLAIVGATAFAEERDGNHFDLLCITLLDQADLVHAKAARLALVGLTMILLPTLIVGLTLVLGWSTWWAASLIVLHCLAAAAFWLLLGMALSLRMAKTSQAIVVCLALVLVFIVSGVLIDISFSNNPTFFALSSSPFHCMFVLVCDNLVERTTLPSGMTLSGMRSISIFYTLANAVAPYAMYWWALQPALPWRAEHPMWLAHAKTEASRVSSAAPLKTPEAAQPAIPSEPICTLR